jgi:hypothetical protein
MFAWWEDGCGLDRVRERWRRYAANCIIEGKGVPALVSGPRGAEVLRGSRAFRNTFRRRPEGWAV